MNFGLMRCAARDAEAGEQRRVRFAQAEAQGHRVDDLDGGDHVEHRRPVGERRVGKMGGVRFVHLAEKAECGGLGVERRAIVEVDAWRGV